MLVSWWFLYVTVVVSVMVVIVRSHVKRDRLMNVNSSH